jgi:hypothetical protein
VVINFTLILQEYGKKEINCKAEASNKTTKERALRRQAWCGVETGAINICVRLIKFYSLFNLLYYSSLNVFDDGAVLLPSILWTLSIVSIF